MVGLYYRAVCITPILLMAPIHDCLLATVLALNTNDPSSVSTTYIHKMGTKTVSSADYRDLVPVICLSWMTSVGFLYTF